MACEHYSCGGSVVQGGVFAPSDTLIWGELPRTLAFEEEDAFPKGISVVVATGNCMEGKQKEDEGKDAKCRNTPRNKEYISRHNFLLVEQ